MSSKKFSSLEIDAIGEILNISLGASATAVSTMLSRRTDITTPSVSVVSREEFQFAEIEPAIGVEITYTSGLSGRNVMLLKRHDVKVICEILMGMEIPDEEFELDEMNLSAVCEVMNQMMGASSTALSEFLGEVVNISTPISFEIPDLQSFKEKYFDHDDEKVVAYFRLKIEDAVESQFMNLMSLSLAKKLLSAFNLGLENEDYQEDTGSEEPAASSGGVMSQEEIERLMGGMSAPEPAPAASSGGVMSQDEIEKLLSGMGGGTPEPAPAASSGGVMSQEEIEKLMGGMGAGAAQAAPQQQMPPQMAQQGAQGQMPPQMGQMGQMPGQGMPPQMGQMGMYGMPPMGMYPGMDGQQMGMYPYGMYPYGMYPPMGMYPGMPGQEQQAAEKKKEPKEPKEPRAPKLINVKPIQSPDFEEDEEGLGQEQAENLSLIMDVPLEVSVEIGRTRKFVKDILELTDGSLVVLDKLAGEQVDVYANGQCIARGDVVVVEDSFAVRITEIVKNPDFKLLGAE